MLVLQYVFTVRIFWEDVTECVVGVERPSHLTKKVYCLLNVEEMGIFNLNNVVQISLYNENYLTQLMTHLQVIVSLFFFFSNIMLYITV